MRSTLMTALALVFLFVFTGCERLDQAMQIKAEADAKIETFERKLAAFGDLMSPEERAEASEILGVLRETSDTAGQTIATLQKWEGIGTSALDIGLNVALGALGLGGVAQAFKQNKQKTILETALAHTTTLVDKVRDAPPEVSKQILADEASKQRELGISKVVTKARWDRV